jgi:hypothetical protein
MKYHIELKEELDKIVTKEVILFYDEYEANFGDGLYPSDEQESHLDSREKHVFQKKGDMWHQISNHCIQGLDGDYGVKLLKKLNQTDELQIVAKLCLNRIKKNVDVVYTPPNMLTQPQFVCKVVDEMINCEWKQQAEEIISYIGGYNCRGIVNTYGKILYIKNM